jgi:Flp pilus assembly protein TadB
MELVTLAGINVILFILLLLIEYISFVRQRVGVVERMEQIGLSSPSLPADRVLLFLPDWLFRQIRPLIPARSPSKHLPREQSVLAEITPVKIMIINLCCLVLGINAQMLLSVPWYAIYIILVAGQAIAWYLLKHNQKNKREALEKRLPEILDIMARVYRVHTDLRISLQEVAKNIADREVSQLFEDMVKISRFGYTVEEAMSYVAAKIESPDLDFVITSIKINIPLGGDLAYLFEHTAQLLRQRKEAKDEIQNLMFQSKFSSMASALIVPIIVVASFVTNPKYQQVLLYNPTGRLIFIGCIFWWLIGVVIIRKNARVTL